MMANGYFRERNFEFNLNILHNIIYMATYTYIEFVVIY